MFNNSILKQNICIYYFPIQDELIVYVRQLFKVKWSHLTPLLPHEKNESDFGTEYENGLNCPECFPSGSRTTFTVSTTRLLLRGFAI